MTDNILRKKRVQSSQNVHLPYLGPKTPIVTE
jgi:hypothetical protein